MIQDPKPLDRNDLDLRKRHAMPNEQEQNQKDLAKQEEINEANRKRVEEQRRPTGPKG